MSENQHIWDAFDPHALKRICEMTEEEFGPAYDMKRIEVDQASPSDFYFVRDNGAPILAVAHLDTVVSHKQRTATFANTPGGPVVHSGALDDRLGAYIILELLPALGINYDVLLTVGEETGQSTASFFDPPREYNWMIEFDRGGTDVVMYQYDDDHIRRLVSACGATPADGIFSDISYLEHLGIKGFNWGVGYQDYHGPRSHAYLADTVEMVGYYLDFHDANRDTVLPHEQTGHGRWGDYWDRYEKGTCQACGGRSVDWQTDWCEACGTCNSCWCDALSHLCECGWAKREREELERAEEYEDSDMEVAQ